MHHVRDYQQVSENIRKQPVRLLKLIWPALARLQIVEKRAKSQAIYRNHADASDA